MTMSNIKPAAQRRVRRDDVIQLRASAPTKALLKRAADLRGQKLSEFMLESARRMAEETILDQRVFVLDEDAYASFLKLLEAPPKTSAALLELMRRKAPWDA